MFQPSNMSKNNSDDEQTSIKERLQSNETMLQQLLQQQKTTDSHLTELGGMVHALSEMLTKLLPASPTPPVQIENPPTSSTLTSGIREPDFRLSELFDGNPNNFGGFSFQCELAFSHSPSLFPTAASKITYIVTLLRGPAQRWTHAYLASNP
ncbi:hypothetical protein AMECASPLE_039074, partial [Ameca splendens]